MRTVQLVYFMQTSVVRSARLNCSGETSAVGTLYFVSFRQAYVMRKLHLVHVRQTSFMRIVRYGMSIV
jgi:hypothetical protein